MAQLGKERLRDQVFGITRKTDRAGVSLAITIKALIRAKQTERTV
jgi:hypothetical protein